MGKILLSNVERVFFDLSGGKKVTTKILYISVKSFPQLGLLSSLRFFEYVSQNPEGVITLPAGKSAQYFISATRMLLEKWDTGQVQDVLKKYGLGGLKRPDLSRLHFVQTSEFYPISSKQHNSLYNYVAKYYINGLGLSPEKALLINSDEIDLAEGKSYREIFPDHKIDLSLRVREAKTMPEELQQQSIFMIDDWCSRYEQKIRDKGGIGFFLGDIGPEGHIGFNTRGSDHFSTTRLTSTNFEIQAVTAADLGGIEISRNRLVITIGLETITYDPECVAIIYAAGEAIADIVRDSLQSDPVNTFPATSLQKLRNSRFYLTKGATVKLDDTIREYYTGSPWSHEKTERAVIDLCKKINKFGSKVTLEDLQNDPYCRLIPGLDDHTVQTVIDSITEKLRKGMVRDTNQVYYHTGPHHDDIMLGLMPATNRQQRDPSNEMHFAVMTSGFTAVTNHFLDELLTKTKHLFSKGEIQMVEYPDFFEEGYKYKWDKDVYHYLDNIAANNSEEKIRGVCHRLIRAIVEIWQVKNVDELSDTIEEILSVLSHSYDGSINPPKIQKLKGMIRELEEELVWAHYGVPVKNIHHLRLGFYQAGLFGGKPDKERDVMPIVNEFRKYKPTVISLAMDPQGSGPDTHYKVLQAIAGAVKEWSREEDLSTLRIHGYRNVWFRYHPSEVEVIIPVSLNALATLDKSFEECYVSQVHASFPSYRLDGKFSTLTQKIWVEQHKQIQFLLGKNFFYQSEIPLLRATHGLVFMREMNVEQFLREAFKLETSPDELFQI